MFTQIHPKLGMVFYHLYLLLSEKGIQEITVTSIIRPKTEDSGVHAEGRAIDVSVNFDTLVAQDVVNTINNSYIYDLKRPHLKTAILHTTDILQDSGLHIHLQVKGD